ncbi:MAG: hypothetical protein RL497_3064 [Pseudomonadota bacterium]|jgi:Leucine-rich repeat (LRR) protein
MIFVTRVHPLIALAFSLATLAGCTGTSKQLISDIKFEDAYIAECVKNNASSQKATYVDELKQLICPGERISQGDVGPSGYARSTKGLEELTALEFLWLGGNWLTALDFSRFPHLANLSIEYNLFQALDLSKNSALVGLDISCNPISKLVLPSSGKLQSFKANLARYAGRPVCFDAPPPDVIPTHIEINSGQPINDQSYLKPTAEWLNLANQSGLKELHLENRGLTEFSLKTLPAQNQLHILAIPDNALVNLDLGNAPQLQYLDATNNPLESIKFLSRNKLVSLKLKNSNIDNSTLQEINAMPALTELFLTANKQLTVAPAIAKLTQLTLDGNRDWDGADFTALPSLETLSMSAGTGMIFNSEKLSMPKLKTLELGKIANQSLTLDALDSLENLSVWGGDVKEIDVTKLKNIKSLSVSQFTGKTFDISSTSTLHSLFLSSKTLASNGLKIPYQLTELSLNGMTWDNLETGGLININKLELTDMSLKKLDLSQLGNLKNLSLYKLHDLLALDLTPLANELKALTLWDNGIVELKAIEFQRLSYAAFNHSRFNEESRINIERLTNARVYMFDGNSTTP